MCPACNCLCMGFSHLGSSAIALNFYLLCFMILCVIQDLSFIVLIQINFNLLFVCFFIRFNYDF